MRPRWNHRLTCVGLQRSFKNGDVVSHQFRFHVLCLLTGGFTHRRTIRRRFHNAGFQAAAHQVRQGFAGLNFLCEIRVHPFPVPLCTGQVTLGGQRCLIGMVTGTKNATALTRFDDHLGAIDMTGDDIDALIDKAIGRLCLFDRHGPIARENDLCGGLWIGNAGPQCKRIDIAQHLRNRFGCDEAQFAGLRRMARHNARKVLGFVDVTKIAPHVLRVLPLLVQAASVQERHIGIFLGDVQEVGIKIAKRGRK